MEHCLVLDTSVLISLRSSLGASFALLRRIDSGRFQLGITNSLILEAALASRIALTSERHRGHQTEVRNPDRGNRVLHQPE